MFGRRLAEVKEGLAAVVRGLDPDCTDARDAAVAVECFAEIERLAAAGKTLMAGRVASTSVWAGRGDRSAAEWLARVGRTGLGEAMQTLDTAERLEDLPATEEALRSGALSRVQVTEIAAAAEADPESEAGLLAAAPRRTIKDLKMRCARVKAAARDDELADYARVRADRHVRTWKDQEGSHLHLQSTPDAIATVLSAMKPYERELFEAARVKGEPESPRAYAADALVAMARDSMLGTGGRERRPGKGGMPRAELRIRCDLPAFVRGETIPGEACEIPGVGPVPVAVARSVAPDAVIDLIVTEGQDVRAIVSKSRYLPRALRIAVEEQYQTCAKWDCDAEAHLERDHVDPYAIVQETRFENTVPWCPPHHDLKTYKGYRAVKLDDGQWDLLPPAQGPDPPPPDRGPPERDGTEPIFPADDLAALALAV